MSRRRSRKSTGKHHVWLWVILALFAIGILAPTLEDEPDEVENPPAVTETDSTHDREDKDEPEKEEEPEQAEPEKEEKPAEESKPHKKPKPKRKVQFSSSDIPAYSGSPYVAVNGNEPYFKSSEITDESYEEYATLDGRGRCGTAEACVGQDLMPTAKRGSIGDVKPTGWHTIRYDCVSGKYLYNRCHLIGYQLTGENANPRNLITGTRALNIDGMLPFENMVADYVQETGNHVMYRVTPIFSGSNALADGVLMEGWSVEDDGYGVCFCVFAYNAQPGVGIDYATGDSWSNEPESEPEPEHHEDKKPEPKPKPHKPDSDAKYILNTSSKKFHLPECSSVDNMSEKNKKEYNGSRQDLIDQDYEPCKRCNP